MNGSEAPRGRISDWPLEFKCLWVFWGRTAREPVLTVDLPPELICSLHCHLRLKKKKKKAVGYQRLYRTTSPVFFSPTPPAHHQHHHTPHWSYQHFGLRRGMVSARPVRSDCRLISQLRRCARLCGKGDYCLLSVFVARSAAVCSATRPGGSRDNSEV